MVDLGHQCPKMSKKIIPIISDRRISERFHHSLGFPGTSGLPTSKRNIGMTASHREMWPHIATPPGVIESVFREHDTCPLEKVSAFPTETDPNWRSGDQHFLPLLFELSIIPFRTGLGVFQQGCLYKPFIFIPRHSPIVASGNDIRLPIR